MYIAISVELYMILSCDTELWWCLCSSLCTIVVGYGPGYDDVVVHGDLDEYKFAAFYTK